MSEEATYHASERAYGAFERLFPLSSHLQMDKLKTKLSNGIFEVAIPKTEAASHESARGKASQGHEEKLGGKK